MINPMRWSLLWSIIRLRVPSFLIGGSVDNWVRDHQHLCHLTHSSALNSAPNTFLLGRGIYKYLDPVGLVFRTGSTSSHWEALATRRAKLELSRVMTSIPPRMGTHESYEILRLMRRECIQYLEDRYHDELPESYLTPPMIPPTKTLTFCLTAPGWISRTYLGTPPVSSPRLTPSSMRPCIHQPMAPFTFSLAGWIVMVQ